MCKKIFKKINDNKIKTNKYRHLCRYDRQEVKLKEYQGLTSYIIPAGTNSGALAERFDEFTAESSWVYLLEADALFAFALCWGMLCLFRSENQIDVFRTIVATVLNACA